MKWPTTDNRAGAPKLLGLAGSRPREMQRGTRSRGREKGEAAVARAQIVGRHVRHDGPLVDLRDIK